jgi:hypothetical protein
MTRIALVDDGDYGAGACNIGDAEVRRRRDAGIVGAAAAAVVAVALVVAGAPAGWRLVVAVPAFFSVLGFAQARSRFCVAFALAGVREAGPGGGRRLVVATDRPADLRKAILMVIGSAAIAGAIGVAFALPAL